MSALTRRVLELLPNARLHYEAANDHELMLYGPPGTGKTTSLGILLDAHIRAGLPPDQMLVNAFTRNATWVLKQRLTSQYGLTEREMPWVRTIHSSCFQLLGLRPDQVMTPWKLRAFGEDCHYEMKGVLIQRSLDDPFQQTSIQTYGDWCFTVEELRRAMLKTVPQIVAMFQGKQPTLEGPYWDDDEALLFSERYRAWKHDHGLFDFSDMLETVLKLQFRPAVRWCWLDEAQDMSPLQWAVADLWAREAQRLFVFSDDDQAIFSFAGADPSLLWRRPGHQLVLSHSYRLPSAIHAEAQRIISRTRTRVPKEFEPHSEGGSVRMAYGWPDVDFVESDETWLMLIRNRAFGDEVRSYLMRTGIPFFDRTSLSGVPGQNSARGRALNVLLALHEGKMVRGSQLRVLRGSPWPDKAQIRPEFWPADQISWTRPYSLADLGSAGATAELGAAILSEPFEAIRMEPHERRYLSRLLARRGTAAITSPPKVELATIHGVKGEEADNVAVSTSMTKRTYLEYAGDEDGRVDANPDPEHRCFYVGITRARRNVFWVVGGRGYAV